MTVNSAGGRSGQFQRVVDRILVIFIGLEVFTVTKTIGYRSQVTRK